MLSRVFTMVRHQIETFPKDILEVITSLQLHQSLVIDTKKPFRRCFVHTFEKRAVGSSKNEAYEATDPHN